MLHPDSEEQVCMMPCSSTSDGMHIMNLQEGCSQACFGAPGKSLTSVEIPQPGGAVVGGRHGQTVVQRVALQDVYLSLMPYQALHLQPRVGVPHPDGVITH